MRELVADVRYALRVMSRMPSFAVAAIGVMALGIGAATASFRSVNAVLLRPPADRCAGTAGAAVHEDAGRKGL